MRALTLFLTGLLCSGCATIFTGTRQEVSIESDPPGATVVVLGGTAAAVAVKAKKVSDIKERILDVMAPALRPPDLALLRSLTLDELVTQAVLGLKLAEVPPEFVVGASQVFAGLPGPIADKVTGLLGVEGVGVTPWKLELKKGHPYALVSWQRTRRARLLVVDTTFNWVVLLNIFVGGVPAVVDVLTGAWFNLSPTEVRYALEPLPQAAAGVTP